MKTLLILSLVLVADQQAWIFEPANDQNSPSAYARHHEIRLARGTCINVEEKKLYDLIMDYRASLKLKSVPFSVKLTKVAQSHVNDLMNHFDYENKNGCNPHSWSDSGKWTHCCYTPDHRAAKCMWDKPREISGYAGDGFEIAYYHSGKAMAEESLEGWKSSPGHNPLLTNTGTWSTLEWKAIGIGISGHYAVVWFGEQDDRSELIVCK